AASLLRPPTGQGYETLVGLDKSQAKASSCLCESWSILDFMVRSHILHLIFTVCTPRAATEEMYRSLKNIAAKRSGTIVPAVTLLGAWGLLLTQHPMDPTATGVVIWWSLLCGVSLLNILAWRRSAERLSRRTGDPTGDAAIQRFQRWQLVLSAGFVLGCAFRA